MSEWKVMQRSNEDAAPCTSLAELCSHWDRAFVERAYWSLLGRAPDPDGGAHYLNQLRTGVSKLTILLRLRESAEGRTQNSEIDGLDEALKKHREAIQPFTGAVVRMLTGREGDTRRERALRAVANHLAAMDSVIEHLGAGSGLPMHSDISGMQRSIPQVTMAPRSELGLVDHLLMRTVRIEASLRRIEDRLKAAAMSVKGGKAARKP
jgi:hypothetical protein